MNRDPSKTGLIIISFLFLITLGVTIWLFFYLTTSESRSETFGLTVGFICFLEILSFGFFALLFIPSIRKHIVWAIYPTIRLILTVYIIMSVIIVVVFNIISSPTAYYIALVINTLVFLLIASPIIFLNVYKKTEDINIRKENKGLIDHYVSVQEVYQGFQNSKEMLDIHTYRDIDIDLRKLKERFQYCTPFGRSNMRAANIEKDIQSRLSILNELIVKLSTASENEKKCLLEDIKLNTVTALQEMERREKLLIK